MIGHNLMLSLTKKIGLLAAAGVLTACGEPIYENAGSQHSLMEDREACAVEINQSPAALAYRENPSANPDYPNQVFEEMNRCIERKGWKQVRSQQEQKQLSDAIATEAAHTKPPVSLSDTKTTDAFTRAVEGNLARVPSAGLSAAERKN
jgi:hypothetical protein